MLYNSTPIIAISTAPGSGAIAVIRLSGDGSIEMADRLFRGSRPLASAAANTVRFGEIWYQNRLLDQVLVSVFRAPHSFTGEDTIEIACHGSIFIQQTILQAYVDEGCQLAKAGEFTQRAFLNGKLDLSEAEAVADLVASETESEHALALHQMRGGIANELHNLREKLLNFTSLVELELDFADHEDLTFVDRTELHQFAQTIHSQLACLLQSFQQGNAIKNGIPVAIIGRTNAGKSTLLNLLVGEEKAIVSSVHGTTRDTIEDVVIINGIRFRFVDTAGIRETDNEIEEIGICRAKRAAQNAAIIIYIVDATSLEPLPYIQELKDKKILTLYNKCDLIPVEKRDPHLNYICAREGQIGNLREQLVSLAGVNKTGTMISNVRHYEALKRAQEAIERVEQGLQEELSGELLSLDLRDCLNALGEITGEITSQDVLNQIFSKFCIGK